MLITTPTKCKTPVAMPPPPNFICGLCSELCKRASKITCCGAHCCWGCGVRSITRARKCWNCPNICAVTKDLVKHSELREAISQFLLTNSGSQEEAKEAEENILKIQATIIDNTGITVRDTNVQGDINEHEEIQVGTLEKSKNKNKSEENSTTRTRSQVKISQINSRVVSISIEDEQKPKEKSADPKESKCLRTCSEELNSEKLSVSDNNSNVPEPVENNSVKEIEPPLINLDKDKIKTDLQIGEEVHIHSEDNVTVTSNTVRAVVASFGVVSTDETKLKCDSNIPEELIHSEEKSIISSSPVKIDLKNSFIKLTSKVKIIDNPTLKSDSELEMFEKNLYTGANGEHIEQESASVEEVRTVKRVDVDNIEKNDKIVRIIEELDKTKSLAKRRKSNDFPSSDKKTMPSKPLEAVPITNALQGLQALLKISKISDSSGNNSKNIDTVCKLGRTRVVSESKRLDDQQESASKRSTDSLLNASLREYKSHKNNPKLRRGDYKESNDVPSLTRINRSALVRDKQVETHSKSLVEEQNKEVIVEDLQSVSPPKPAHHESGRSRSKFQSFQMKDIRKRLLPVSNSSSTISKRAAEVAKKVKDDGEEVKVLSYRIVKPKIDDVPDNDRIFRKMKNSKSALKEEKIKSKKKRIDTNAPKQDSITEKVVRKVIEVKRGDVLSNPESAFKDEPLTENKNNCHINEDNNSPCQKDIVELTEDNLEMSKEDPEKRKSLDLIKEELKRVKSKVHDIKKSTSREVSSDDDMKVLMKDVHEMEKEVEDISEEAENERKVKSWKKKHKDDKKKKSKHNGDIAIDARIAKKIISRIISSDMGKTFTEVVKQEVGETESTIEKLREDLKKKSSQEEKTKKKRKKEKKKEEKDRSKKKKKKDRYWDEEADDFIDEDRKKKSRSKLKSRSHSVIEDEEHWNATLQSGHRRDKPATRVELEGGYKNSDFKKSKKRKSSSPVRFYDQMSVVRPSSESDKFQGEFERRKNKKTKYDEKGEICKKKKSKKLKKDKEADEKELVNPESNDVIVEVTECEKTSVDVEEKTTEKKCPSPSKDFELVLDVAEDDLLDNETDVVKEKEHVEPCDSMTETDVDTTIDDNCSVNPDTDVSTSVVDAALEDVPVRESPAVAVVTDTGCVDTSRNLTNSGATSSANSEDEQSEDEDNLRALLLSQLSKTRCGSKDKSKKRSSSHTKPSTNKITKITWSSPTPEPVEVSSTTPPVPPPTTAAASYPPIGSLPVYGYAYSRTFITPAEKLTYFPNLYNRIIVPLDLESDSDSDCQSDCESFWEERRTSQWVSERIGSQGFSEADPRFSQANLNLVMRQARDSSSPAPI